MDVLRYNARAAAVVGAHGGKLPSGRPIGVCDLHAVINAHCGANYTTCDIAQCKGPHFTEPGFAMLGDALAKCVVG